MNGIIKTIGFWLLNVLHWLCTTVGALVIVGFLTVFCRSCYHDHKPESVLYGIWEKVDSEDGYNDHTLTFDWNGEYYNSNTGAWNYDFIEPDSLILYHHGLYEERYKILKLMEDTMTVRMSEYIFHAVDNGKEIEYDYGGSRQPIYIYIRKSHSRIPPSL